MSKLNLSTGPIIPSEDNIGYVVRVDYPRTQLFRFHLALAGLVDAAVLSLGPALMAF